MFPEAAASDDNSHFNKSKVFILLNLYSVMLSCSLLGSYSTAHSVCQAACALLG